MLSVNTNAGAMVALQNLTKTNTQMTEVQQRINTGLDVAGAKDDGGKFAIAQRMRAQVGGYEVVKDSLNRTRSVVDVALAASEGISDLLIEMKAKALAASDVSLDSTSRTALNETSGPGCQIQRLSYREFMAKLIIIRTLLSLE